jgi:hypothetical protein
MYHQLADKYSTAEDINAVPAKLRRGVALIVN